jgi:hypothetical protein
MFTIICQSCAHIYLAPDGRKLAQKHKIIAILPPSVSIEASRKVDGESLKEQQKTESLNFQEEMYSWILKRKSKNKMDQEILDIATTNAKLKNAGYPEKALSPFEMCEILNVDGVITSNFALSKPMSNGAAIALIFVGGFGSTNKVRVQLSINDCANKKLIWNFKHKYNGGLGSSPSSLIEDIMRQASKKTPYID